MPSAHHNTRVLSRGKGQSALSSAAYQHGVRMTSTSGDVFDHPVSRDRVSHSEILLPESAPDWVQEAFGRPAFEETCADVLSDLEDPGVAMIDTAVERAAWALLSEQLWRSVEEGEDRLNKRRRDAALARRVTLAVPRMLERKHQITLLRGYIEEAYTSLGMIADWVLRNSANDNRHDNPHALILLTMRRLAGEDWNRLKAYEWNKRAVLHRWRRLWSEHANRILAQAGCVERIDHRTLAAQQIALGFEPSIVPEYYVHPPCADPRTNAQARQEQARYADTRRCNQAYLRAHPEHMLALVQIERSSFTRQDVTTAFARRLDLDGETDRAILETLTDRAMRSSMVQRVVESDPDGPPRFQLVTAIHLDEGLSIS